MTYLQARLWAWEVFGNLGQSIAEGIQFSRRFKKGSCGWEKLCEAENPELEKELLRDPRPKVLVTGHLGSWEVALMMVSLRVGGNGGVIPHANVRGTRIRS